MASTQQRGGSTSTGSRASTEVTKSKGPAPVAGSDSDNDDDDGEAPAAVSFSASKSTAKRRAEVKANTVTDTLIAEKARKISQTRAQIERNIRQKADRRARLGCKNGPSSKESIPKETKQGKTRPGLSKELPASLVASLVAEGEMESDDTGAPASDTVKLKKRKSKKGRVHLGADISARVDAGDVVKIDHGIGAVVVNASTTAESISGLTDSTRAFLKEHFYGSRVARVKTVQTKHLAPARMFGAAAKAGGGASRKAGFSKNTR